MNDSDPIYTTISLIITLIASFIFLAVILPTVAKYLLIGLTTLGLFTILLKVIG